MKLFYITVLVIIGYVSSQCPSNDETLNLVEARKALYNGQQNFSLTVFNIINKLNEEDNVFFSPFSIYQAILLGYFSSSNHTEDSLKEALQLSDQPKINVMKGYKLDNFYRNLNQSESYQFSSANKVYVSKELPLRDCMTKFFTEELEKLDFSTDPANARDHINKWVAEQTKNNILDLVPEDGVDDTTKIVLANAAYFKGVWISSFQPEATKKKIFYSTSTQQSFVEMMSQKGTFNYGVSEELRAMILEMPYKGRDVSLYVLLPPFVPKNGIDYTISKLNAETLNQIVEDEIMMGREVQVEFPKVTLEKTIPLRRVFEEMGAGAFFDTDADFSSLTNLTSGVFFREAEHKAKIRIDEAGTVASAATAILSLRSSRPVDPAKFICDHPFLYFLYDKPTKTILFMGVFRDPKKLS